MIYKATIIDSNGRRSKDFNFMHEAAEWLDSENNKLEATTMIETFDETGRKTDGFYYKEKSK